MKIYHLLEEANLELQHLTPELRYLINQEFSQSQWVSATKYFLRGIGNQHTLTGKLVFQLRDICWEYDRGTGMTATQCMFLSNNLVDNWHQIAYEYRSLATM
jgi:hypothetical protein